MSAERFTGIYRATVANNTDPLNETRVTVRIPQILGSAESAWALPTSPTNRVPPVGQVVWVQFSGGDITKPVYAPLGLKDITAGQLAADAINGKTIDGVSIVGSSSVTGAVVRTADELHPRTEIVQEVVPNVGGTSSVGALKFFDTATTTTPGSIYALPASGITPRRLALTAPGAASPAMTLYADGKAVAGAPITGPVDSIGNAWQTFSILPIGWGAATQFQGVSPVDILRFRRDAEDCVVFYGAIQVVNTGATSTPFQMPDGYYNTAKQSGFPALAGSSSGGAVSTGFFYVSTSGNAHFDTGAGFPRNAGDVYFLNGKIPLGNLS